MPDTFVCVSYRLLPTIIPLRFPAQNRFCLIHFKVGLAAQQTDAITKAKTHARTKATAARAGEN